MPEPCIAMSPSIRPPPIITPVPPPWTIPIIYMLIIPVIILI
jgi:hypothetical protein